MALCAAMLFGVAASLVTASAQAYTAPRPAAILTVISGHVFMRTTGGDFTSAMDGAVLRVGAMLRTSADARALITLFEGSTVELDPASDITIEGATGGSTIARALGRSWNVVMHLTTADSRYELTTPAATASVRGGDYEVAAADALSGVTTTMTTLEHRVPTTVAVSAGASVVTPAQTTALRAASAPVSTRSAVGAERVRKLITQNLAARALPVARKVTAATTSNWTDDRDNERED